MADFLGRDEHFPTGIAINNFDFLTWATTQTRKWHKTKDLDHQTKDPDLFLSTRCSNVLVLAINTWIHC